MDWFLYDNGLRHERVNPFYATGPFLYRLRSLENLWFFKMESSGTEKDQ